MRTNGDNDIDLANDDLLNPVLGQPHLEEALETSRNDVNEASLFLGSVSNEKLYLDASFLRYPSNEPSPEGGKEDITTSAPDVSLNQLLDNPDNTFIPLPALEDHSFNNTSRLIDLGRSNGADIINKPSFNSTRSRYSIDPVLREGRETLQKARCFRSKLKVDRFADKDTSTSNSSRENRERDDTGSRRSKSGDVTSNNKVVEIRFEKVHDETEETDPITPDGVDDDDDGEGRHDSADSTEYDFDGDFPDTETFDLAAFDFECLTKPKSTIGLKINQLEYKRFCGLYKVLPNAFILRSLATHTLRLSSQQLGTQRIKALCSALAYNCTVYELEISEDEISDQAMGYLVEALNENDSIEQLFLRNNQMGRQPVKQLVEYLEKRDRLLSLNLSGNRLEDSDGQIFTAYLSTSVCLMNLDLSNNRFRIEAPEVIGKALIKNTTLANLSLAWNHIREQGLRALLSTLVKNHGVECLDISWNSMNLVSVRTLCTVLKKNSTLTAVDISACRINGKELMEISGMLTKAKHIRSIILGNNIFSLSDLYLALNQIFQTKSAVSVREVDLLNTAIDPTVYNLCQLLLDKKDIMVLHGRVVGMDAREVTDADELATMNPVTVLIEYGRLLGMGVRELFEFMDTQGDKMLTREDLKAGLLQFDIPLPDRSLDLLIRRLDMDGDGLVSVAELMASGSMNARDRLRDKMLASQTKTSLKNSETMRCRKILRRMIKEYQRAKREKAKKARKSERGQKKKRRSTRKRGDGSMSSTASMPPSETTSLSEATSGIPSVATSDAEFDPDVDIFEEAEGAEGEAPTADEIGGENWDADRADLPPIEINNKVTS